MTLQPARCAGDAPPTAREQGMPDPSPHAPTPPTPASPNPTSPNPTFPNPTSPNPASPTPASPNPSSTSPTPSTPTPTSPTPTTPSTSPTSELDHCIRLPAPARGARLRSEREQWQRRRSLERQLHDGAALRISALALHLGLFRTRVPAEEPQVHASIDVLQDELHAVLQELRDVAGKLYPPLLDEAGLGPALREVAGRIATPVRIRACDHRFCPAAEGAAYFAVTETLEALEPGAPAVEVAIRRDDADVHCDVLVVDVVGIDVRHAGGMLDQVRRLGGTVDVAGGPGAGTITVRIPCE